MSGIQKKPMNENHEASKEISSATRQEIDNVTRQEEEEEKQDMGLASCIG